MNVLPMLKKCPCCNSFNLFKINGITYDNKFKSLSEWILKKELKCRKCHENLGLFVHKKNKNLKLVWINFLECEDVHFKKLCDLQIAKNKSEISGKQYSNTLKRINDIQNEIRSNQTKLKVKLKIQNREIFVRHAS